jgi:hypothetical protein
MVSKLLYTRFPHPGKVATLVSAAGVRMVELKGNYDSLSLFFARPSCCGIFAIGRNTSR